jgi:hypothetical protein
MVRQPDAVANDYLLLALRLDQRIPGLVDGYFGPAALKAQVDLAQPRSPERLRDDARALSERIARHELEPDRRVWLAAQVDALAAQADQLVEDDLSYETLVARCMGFAPPRRDDTEFEAAAVAIDGLLPGRQPLGDRLDAWDRQLEIPTDRLPGVIDWLVERFRLRAALDFGLPDGEDLRVGLVRDQPWAGYNWFDGGRRSRVDVNIDLPIRAPNLVHTMAHETYPGHHLEHAWKEADLVDHQGRLEASILLINTPECPISEGLADLGLDFAVPPGEHADVLVELFERAGLAVADDPIIARETAARCVALSEPRRSMAAIRGEAAFRRHADGRPSAEVLAYLQEVGRYSPTRAAKRLEFIEHPLWRTYVFVYAEGEALLRRWLDVVAPDDRKRRFGRLLHEQLTPASIPAETHR